MQSLLREVLGESRQDCAKLAKTVQANASGAVDDAAPACRVGGGHDVGQARCGLQCRF